ncbi:MAG: hypothetical protein ACRDPF_20255 [Streptosporangiaceae bacterium]
MPVDGAWGALGILTTGPVSSMVSRNCTQTPGQTNTNTTTTGNVNNG